MKKLSILIACMFFSSFCFSQWSVGARVGPNFSTLTGGWSENGDSKSGWITSFGAGTVANYEFTEMISVNGELLFITIGDKTEYTSEEDKSTENGYGYTYTGRYHYLQMPILARFLFGSNFIFYANLGPYFGYKIGGNYKREENGHVTEGRIRFKRENLEPNDELFNSDLARRFDLGIYVGGGAGKKLGPGVLEVDLRLGIGLLDHNKFESKDDKNNAKDAGYKAERTMNILITIAYMYPFGKDTPTRFIN